MSDSGISIDPVASSSGYSEPPRPFLKEGHSVLYGKDSLCSEVPP